ncbi:MAG: hypothetical protein VXV96_06830 [Bdellovibrionota bacterium]|jgi:hypothetical protein|nr:hypothetical protein [Bdellovibrionota bacterium]
MISILMNPTQEVLIGMMCLAAFRIYLEIIGFDLLELPLTKALTRYTPKENIARFHRVGLIFCVGFILLFAPELLYS